jgi:methyl-accepting chemotaxis protein
MRFDRLRHLTVASRIALGFGFMMLILLIQSAMGFLAARESTRVMQEDIARVRGQAEAANDLRDLILQEDLHIRQMAVLVDADRIRAEADRIQQVGQRIDQALKSILATSLDAKHRAAPERIGQITAESQPALAEVISLSATLQTDQANQRYEEALSKASAQRRELATQYAQSRREALDQALLEVGQLAQRSQIATVVSALFALVAAAVAGLVLYRAIVTPMKTAVSIADQVASGNLTVNTRSDARNEFGDMLRALQRMSDQMRQTITAIHDSSESVLTASQEIAAGNSDLSSRTEQQASMLQMTAASMMDMSRTVNTNAQAAQQADQLAAQAADIATSGGGQVQRLVETMHSISASSQKMSDIVGVIDGIAFQTNILALNASVEAARAGEQGRGFSVVASEVRSLAQRSAVAAREIKELIASNMATVSTGTHLVADTGAMMKRIVDANQRVTEVVADIARASGAQTETVEQINGAVAQMDHGVQQNAALVEQSAAAAASLQSQAQTLNASVRAFRVS